MKPSRLITFAATIMVAFFIAATAKEARATTFYVSPNGSDASPGTLSAPLASPGQALGLASPGDTIMLRGGRYTFTRGLVIEKDGITISNYNGESPALVGSSTDTTNLLSMVYITANNVSLIGIEIQGGSYYGVKLESNTGTTIRNCHLHDTGRDTVKMYLADNVTFENCEMGPTGVRDPTDAQGINSVACNSTIVRGCHFHDTAQNGLYVKGGGSNCLIENNLIERAGFGGILLGQDTDVEFMRDGTQWEAINCIARNNVVINAGGCGVGTFSGNNVRFENNTLINVATTYNAGLYVVANGQGTGARQVTFKNNIVIVTSGRPMFYVISLTDQLLSDYNLFFNSASSTYHFWEDPQGNYWSSLANWQSGMSCDAHSLSTDPMLDSANLYRPKTGSPVIDHGVTIAEVATDYAGTSRPQGAGYDIGAFEVAGAALRPPTVAIQSSSFSGVAPLTVSFIANASSPNGAISSYSWTFGDGQSSTTANPTHVYTTGGSFNASVTVRDVAAQTATANLTISATNPPPPGGPQVTIAASSTTGTAPVSVSFTANAADASSAISSYRWDFGDGQSSTGTASTGSHLYTGAGSFTARVTVTDGRGQTATATAVITVAAATVPPPPVPPTTGGTQNVVWTNVLGCSVSGNSLTKTAVSTWGNAGASSTQAIGSGNAYVQFTAAETTRERLAGFSTQGTTQGYATINFGVHLNTGGAFYVVEAGNDRGYFGDYQANDVFKVSIESGVVKYYRNNSVFYTSKVAPSYPMFVGAALDGQGSTIIGAVISAAGSGSSTPPTIKVVQPATAEVVKMGSTYNIIMSPSTDSTSSSSGAVLSLDILLSVDGGSTWNPIVTGLPGSTTTYSWTVPAQKAKKAMLRVLTHGVDGSMQTGTTGSFVIAKKKA